MTTYRDSPYTLEESGGDWILRHDDLGEIERFDESADVYAVLKAYDFNGFDISNVGTVSATTGDFDNATVATSPSEASDVAIKSYVDSVAQGLDWQDSVLDEQNDPPSSPADGDRYLTDNNPTGAWDTHPNEIAEWDGTNSEWDFFVPDEGWAVFLEDTNLLKVYDASDWIEFGSAIDHGALAGLGDDDHTQYLLVDGTRQMAGPLDMGSHAVKNATAVGNQDYNEAVRTTSGQSGTVSVDLSTANWHEIEADGDITISFSNVTSSPPGNSVVIYLEDSDGTGPHTVSWPSSVVWNNGSAVTEIPSDGDLEITLVSPDGGSEWRGRKSGESFT